MDGIAYCHDRNLSSYRRKVRSGHLIARQYLLRKQTERKKLCIIYLIRSLVLLFFGIMLVPRASAEPLIFLSTQLSPIHETNKMRQVILKGFPGEVDFKPCNKEVFNQLVIGSVSDIERPYLIGGLHGDFVALYRKGILNTVDDMWSRLEGREFVESFIQLGVLDGEHHYFIPWMQATYIMAANRRALKHLPKGADLDRLSYDQLEKWALKMHKAAGESKLGFPVGTKGLMHRFLQGYLYPSYTGSTVRKFRSPEAETMWKSFRELWKHVSPRSLSYNSMGKPLLTGEVWVAWDHTARLLEAFQEQPDEFVAFPAPAGPKGRGFMVVLAGLGLPKDSYSSEAADLIEYLTRSEVQIVTLESVGFFPVVQTGEIGKLPPGLAKIKDGVSKQAVSRDAVPSLLPVGLGERAKDFNMAYLGAFSKIVLRGGDIRPVLESQAERLRQIISEVQARCWPPDKPSTGPCPVE